MPSAPIYVETLIDAPMDVVWRATQDPSEHQKWDLRFSRIEYLRRDSEREPQRFRYATRIGFGLWVEGRGESFGSSEREGERSSALRFWSDDPRSLIREGSGYWKYVATEGGVRFLTRYDYTNRYGSAGAWIDRLCFRPLLGWATAWSFDALRIALERGVPSRTLVAAAGAQGAARFALAGVWLYQGLVPKLLWPDSGELEILRGSGLPAGWERAVLSALGAAEILFGLLLVARFHSPSLARVQIAALLVLLSVAAWSSPATLVAAFNPVALTLAMIALALVELHLLGIGLPSAARCLRSPRS